MKKQKETISVDITMNHYGFYHSDNHFGNEHKPYRDWVVKKTGIKEWDDYHSGMWTTDIEMIDDWIEEDIGKGDLTSSAITKKTGKANWIAKEEGIFCGVGIIQKIFKKIEYL